MQAHARKWKWQVTESKASKYRQTSTEKVVLWFRGPSPHMSWRKGGQKDVVPRGSVNICKQRNRDGSGNGMGVKTCKPDRTKSTENLPQTAQLTTMAATASMAVSLSASRFKIALTSMGKGRESKNLSLSLSLRSFSVHVHGVWRKARGVKPKLKLFITPHQVKSWRELPSWCSAPEALAQFAGQASLIVHVSVPWGTTPPHFHSVSAMWIHLRLIEHLEYQNDGERESIANAATNMCSSHPLPCVHDDTHEETR